MRSEALPRERLSHGKHLRTRCSAGTALSTLSAVSSISALSAVPAVSAVSDLSAKLLRAAVRAQSAGGSAAAARQ